MSRKKFNIGRLGFVDITMRDTDNQTVFRSKGKNLARGIQHFEKFLDEKFGVKGFSAHEFEGFPRKKKRKHREDFDGLF